MKPKKKNNNTSSQMLLDHCYTFGLLLWPSNSEEIHIHALVYPPPLFTLINKSKFI